MDDDVFEEDEHFYLHLNNLRVRTKDGLIVDPLKLGGVPLATLELPSTATVMILGLFQFIHLSLIFCLIVTKRCNLPTIYLLVFVVQLKCNTQSQNE